MAAHVLVEDNISGDEGVVCGNITVASDKLPYEFVIRNSGWNTSSIADAPPGTVANHLHGYSAFQIGSAVTALFISQNKSYYHRTDSDDSSLR